MAAFLRHSHYCDTDHGARRLRHVFHHRLGFLGPGDGFTRHRLEGRGVGFLPEPDMAGRFAEQVLRRAANIKVRVGMDTGFADQKQAGF